MIKVSVAGGESLPTGIETFSWTTSEQVWPFEKHSDGSTLYAKQINFGSLPANGYKYVAHGISNFNTGNDIFFMHVTRKVNSTYYITIPSARNDNKAVQISAGILGSDVFLVDGYDYSANTAIFRLIYKKTA